MLHIATPIVADRMYIGQSALLKSEVQRSADTLRGRTRSPGSDAASDDPDNVLISRQALHALRLTIRHPHTGKEMQFEASLPADFERTLQFLRSAVSRNGS